jgi:hypothetical protein
MTMANEEENEQPVICRNAHELAEAIGLDPGPTVTAWQLRAMREKAAELVTILSHALPPITQEELELGKALNKFLNDTR